jgi:acetyl-CoA acetyltransferase family protein
LYIAGGTESMSRAPFVTAKSESAFARSVETYDTTLGWRFINKKLSLLYHPFSMGETAENVAKQYNVSREAQDVFAFNSQEKYVKAQALGAFANEIVGLEIVANKQSFLFDTDEHPRQTSIEKLASLQPAFIKNGTVTAGNSSGINDGAAALLLASEEAVKLFNLQPIAVIKSMAIAGVDPSIMGIGPVPATTKALLRAGLGINNIDCFEVNEAFAAQAIACINSLEIDPLKTNVNGGSIALGHPLGCSGARIATTLLHEMKKNKLKFGLATMCIGVGQGAAIVFEGV